MKHLLCGIVAAVVAATAVFAAVSPTAQAAPAKKKAIVVTSFGTTFDDARTSCIEATEKRIQAAFPDYEVRRAFTSRIILKRLAQRGISYDTLEQALDKLRKEGYEEIVLQPLHLTTGEEYENKIRDVAAIEKQYFRSFSVGRPILTWDGTKGMPDDYAIAVKALRTQLPQLKVGEAVVFMGHGSPHQHNPAYQALQDKFDAAKLAVTVGVVEETDHPNLEDVIARLQAKRGLRSVTLMPLMLVAGDHANNDMAGDEPDSWKSQIAAQGFTVGAYVRGLGENKAIQDIYVQHVKDAIDGKYSNYQL